MTRNTETAPALQECLEWLDARLAPYANDEDLDLIPAWSAHRKTKRIMQSIRAQLEAGKQCAEALRAVSENYGAVSLVRNPYGIKRRKYASEALSRATATGLIEGKS